LLGFATATMHRMPSLLRSATRAATSSSRVSARRRLAMAPSLTSTSVRSLSSSQSLQSSESAPAADAPAEPDNATIIAKDGMWRRFGLYPTAGLGLMALISKEIYVIDSQTLLAANFAAFVGIAYVAAGPTVSNFFDNQRAAAKEKMDGWMELQVETDRAQLTKLQNEVAQAEVQAKLASEFKESTEQLYRFKNAQLRHDARAAMVARLESIVIREREQEARVHVELCDAAVNHVRGLFEKGSESDHGMVDWALNHIGTVDEAKAKSAPHPVQKAFQAFFKSDAAKAIANK